MDRCRCCSTTTTDIFDALKIRRTCGIHLLIRTIHTASATHSIRKMENVEKFQRSVPHIQLQFSFDVLCVWRGKFIANLHNDTFLLSTKSKSTDQALRGRTSDTNSINIFSFFIFSFNWMDFFLFVGFLFQFKNQTKKKPNNFQHQIEHRNSLAKLFKWISALK